MALGERGGVQAERGERARPVAGDQHVRPGQQLVEGRAVAWRAQVEQRAALAGPAVECLEGDLGQGGRIDAQDVGPQRGEVAGAHRPGDDAREVEDPHAGRGQGAGGEGGERRRSGRPGPQRQQRRAGERGALGMGAPRRLVADRSGAAAGADDGVLDRDGAAGGDRRAHRLGRDAPAAEPERR
ncbi:MAG TPA: hypothetical protein VLA98_02935, partial [Solirubrobacteraceae bacterium]|nr:hypothetical protein [Solirubrobacteraceae bacterium]